MPTILISQEMADLFDEECAAAEAATARAEHCLDEHGYGCARAECGRGPCGSIRGLADLLPTSDPACIVAPRRRP